MRKIITSILFYSIFLGILNFSLSFAYIIDGKLDDWGDGIIPFSDWYPNSNTIEGTVEDDERPCGGDVWGGEYYDVEALYFDDDGEYFYFAMVSSYPLGGRLAGDLGIDLDSDEEYEYGVRRQRLINCC
jgi:hypothetical protein